MVKRIGLLTSGGDCQGLNSALRGVARALYEKLDKVEFLGFRDGYRGLIQKDYVLMHRSDFSGILTIGGTILGTSRMPIKQIDQQADPHEMYGPTRLMAMVSTYNALNLDALVILGGNGTHKTANLLAQNGLNIITLPKTIDNDLWGTDVTFGFQSSVDMATLVVDSIHTTASSHGRVFIIELMGNRAGWLTLFAGIAGGADVILIPEIPFSIDTVIHSLELRNKQKKRFSIIAVAEGALSTDEAKLSKKEVRRAREQSGFPSIAYLLAHLLGEKTGQEIRVTVPGHFQRGGPPDAYDRVLTSVLGTSAADLIIQHKFGVMVGFQNNQVVTIPLEEVAGRQKLVPSSSIYIQTARDLGICLGDDNAKKRQQSLTE